MKKYLIFSPSYNELSGGAIVLHKLCHILNTLGYESYLYPLFKSYEINERYYFKNIMKVSVQYFIHKLKYYRTNESFNTPVFQGRDTGSWKEWIVIYPETVFGNPLNAKNVVRWFLHSPGRHTNKIYYGENELYYDFNDFAKGFSFPGSKLSGNKLYVTHFPLEYYNLDNAFDSSMRSGTAYCLRKGDHKSIVHDLYESILIDGKSHEAVSRIFKKIDTFISYDTHTAYSKFAVLCGAKSIVVPDDNVSVNGWYKNVTDRYGIAYGFDENELKRASDTSKYVLEDVLSKEEEMFSNVKTFVNEVEDYFK